MSAAAAPSLSVLLNRLRGPRNLLLVVPHFVLSLDIVLADTLTEHDRALLVGGLLEPLLTAFQEEGARR